MTTPVQQVREALGARLREIRKDVVVEKGEFGTWQARTPEENGCERFVCRHGLKQLLDRLCELLAER